MVWLRISPEMDFYMEADLPGVDIKTNEFEAQQYEKDVYKQFLERLKKAFPEGDFRMYAFEFGIAREKHLTKAA